MSDITEQVNNQRVQQLRLVFFKDKDLLHLLMTEFTGVSVKKSLWNQIINPGGYAKVEFIEISEQAERMDYIEEYINSHKRPAHLPRYIPKYESYDIVFFGVWKKNFPNEDEDLVSTEYIEGATPLEDMTPDVRERFIERLREWRYQASLQHHRLS
ncbi:hypothetical protein LCGC14_0267770 [marine sediment metagenome]|uniref:Uncharacterized protein n=1 Tax=marine sediment metagenome TaxID=412755 RepID=A0A0F9WKQ6_9ZZZZ